MKNKMRVLFGVVILFAFSCETKQIYLKAPISDLGHIDLVLDSIDYYSVITDTFLTGEFALYFRDTVIYGGKPSYDIYLAGQENFFHISLAKGYWQDKAGSGVIVFQTRKPEMKDSLLITWKQYYTDSLTSHVFNGDGFDLGEIMIYRPKGQASEKQTVFFSNLTSYSQQTLKNRGMNDSSIANGISMREFMKDWDTTIPSKLFKKITQLNVQVTQDEFKDLESALKTVGYTQTGDSFTHKSNPKVFFEIVSESKSPKYKRIEIELSRPTSEKNFSIGNAYNVTIKGTKMIWSAK